MKKQPINLVSSQIVDKVKAALDTAVGILNDKDGWKVNWYLFNVYSSSAHGQIVRIITFLQIENDFWIKVEKEKEGATIKSKKNAEGRKARLNLFSLQNWYFSGLALRSGDPSAC